ncbi:MAG: hypothetical protein ABL901_12300 [Hyphomicrobiaceae bacterium]
MRAIVFIGSIAVLTVALSAPVDAATRCSIKMADGTGPDVKVAKFQVYEGLLKSIGWSTWSQWMLDGSTPGYKVGKPVYVCRQGMGLGVSCRGRATVCTS